MSFNLFMKVYTAYKHNQFTVFLILITIRYYLYHLYQMLYHYAIVYERRINIDH